MPEGPDYLGAPVRQLDLRPVAQSEHAREWAALRRMLRAALDDVGVKQAAYDLDVAPSVLLDGLAERGRHHAHAEWVPYLVARARSHELVEYLAGLRGLEVRKARPASPEERLEATEAALGELLGPELLAVLRGKVARLLAERGR